MELDEVDEIVSIAAATAPGGTGSNFSPWDPPMHRSTNSSMRARARRNSWLKSARTGKKRNHGKRKRSVALLSSRSSVAILLFLRNGNHQRRYRCESARADSA